MNSFLHKNVRVLVMMSLFLCATVKPSERSTDLRLPLAIGGVVSAGVIGVLYQRDRQRKNIELQLNETNARLLKAKMENADIERLCPDLHYCGESHRLGECPFLHTTPGFNQLYGFLETNNLSGKIQTHQTNRKNIAADLIKWNDLKTKEELYPKYSSKDYLFFGGLTFLLFLDVVLLSAVGPTAVRQLYHAARNKQRN